MMIADRKSRAKVSVVVPIYNTEKYLDAAVKSLLSQTMNNIEIILVNDGSNDNSGTLADSYAGKYPNVKVIHQKNKGISIARNAGISAAKGEYIAFVDSDDWIEATMYEKMYNIAKQYDCDIVSCNIMSTKNMKRDEDSNVYPFTTNECLSEGKIRKEILPLFIKNDNFASSCNKIYKLDTLKKNHIFFPNNISIGEDYIFNISAFYHISRFFHLPETLYNYRFVEGSSTNNYKCEQIEFYIKLYLLKNSIIKKWDFVDPEERKKLSAEWFINKVLHCIYKEISLRRIPGIIKGFNIMNHKFVREKVGEITVSPYNDDRFMNYLFNSMVKRKYTKMLMAIYYVEFLSPIISRFMRTIERKKGPFHNGQSLSKETIDNGSIL